MNCTRIHLHSPKKIIGHLDPHCSWHSRLPAAASMHMLRSIEPSYTALTVCRAACVCVWGGGGADSGMEESKQSKKQPPNAPTIDLPTRHFWPDVLSEVGQVCVGSARAKSGRRRGWGRRVGWGSSGTALFTHCPVDSPGLGPGTPSQPPLAPRGHRCPSCRTIEE